MSAETSPDDQRLLPGRIRRPAAVLAAACAVVFVVLAVKYHGDDTGGTFDNWVFGSLRHRHLPNHALTRLADLVPPVFALVVTALTITTLALRKWRYAALAVLGPGLSMLVVEGGKNIVGRTLDGMLALPSGHTAGVTSVSLVVAALLIDRLRSHVVLAAALALVAVTIMACAIALVMVAARFHYATDTIAGYCAATAITLGVAFALDAIASSRARVRTPAIS
jgi:undecaprenyl-diphosphatase